MKKASSGSKSGKVATPKKLSASARADAKAGGKAPGDAVLKKTKKALAKATPAALGLGDDGEAGGFHLRLYVAGQTTKSVTAFANLKRLCETHLAGRYKIEVIDLLKNPALAAGDQIVAVPTLVKNLPPPLKRVIGNLADDQKFLVGLDLKPTT